MAGVFNSVVGGGKMVSNYLTNKNYLEQQLLPLQVYMDDIENVQRHLPNEIYKCRLAELESSYRTFMGFDYSVRVRTKKNTFELFKAERMKFERSNHCNQLLEQLIPGITRKLNPNTQLVVFNADITQLDPETEQVGSSEGQTYLSVYKTDKYKGGYLSGYTYQYTIKCWQNNQFIGETKAFWPEKTNEILKKFRMLKHMDSAYIKLYDRKNEGKYECVGGDCPDHDIYAWVDGVHIYRGIYQPLSPFTCDDIKELKLKQYNNNGWGTVELKHVVDGWNQAEYIYLAMKSMFDELSTIATLKIQEILTKNEVRLSRQQPVKANPVPKLDKPGYYKIWTRNMF